MDYKQEIELLKQQIVSLKSAQSNVTAALKQLEYKLDLLEKEFLKTYTPPTTVQGEEQEIAIPEEILVVTEPTDIPPIIPETENIHKVTPYTPPQNAPNRATSPKPKTKNSLEKFIGENLINKIGIAILIIGVGIGAKYSIDHNLISPIARIVLGYVLAIVLMLVGMKLKPKYKNFSAVLVSGSTAIMYFLTYAAYSYYGIFNQIVAFALMVLFTIFTILASINFNLQVIAIIGLVGAYAVPILLSDGSGKVQILFSYIGILNIGILILSFKKYWKSLFYSSFSLTWLIYTIWFVLRFDSDKHIGLAFSFLIVYFVTFYVVILAYKLKAGQKYTYFDFIFIFLNAIFFYTFGCYLTSCLPSGDLYFGLFTVANALIHFTVGTIVYRKKLVDSVLFYFIFGLVLTFLTIAIPIQFDGNWVTLFWALEGLVFFFIARKKHIKFYEIGSYILLVIGSLSLLDDWGAYHPTYDYAQQVAQKFTPITSIQFYTSLLFAGVLATFKYVAKKWPLLNTKRADQTLNYVLNIALLIVLYVSFNTEIQLYWTQAYNESALKITQVYEGEMMENTYYNNLFTYYKNLSAVIFACVFFGLLSWLNIKKFQNEILGYFNIVLNCIVLLAFLTVGLYALSEIRELYLNANTEPYFQYYSPQLGLRYVTITCMLIMVFTLYKLLQQSFMQGITKMQKSILHLLLCVFSVWLLSSELLQWMSLMRSQSEYKLALSILWGICSLILIIIGIWKNKAPIRVGAICLFGVTLIKLFFYDIAHLSTISKTIVMVSLGVLLLIISFLYNKYKHRISENETNNA